MKVYYSALAALCACAIIAGPAAGQTLRHPASVRPAALPNDSVDYYGYYGDQEEPSPSDQPAAAEPAPIREPALDMTGGACGSCGVCDSCCDNACDSCFLFGPSEPFTLFPNNNSLGLKAGLWTQIGYHTEGTNGIGTGLMNNYPNHLQLHQQWFYLEKAVDTGGCGFDWGFRVDYVYGTDGPDTQAFGGRIDSWDYGWFNGGAYGHAIPQAYVELGYNDLTAKIGHFYTIMGYEAVPATGNFFYSHAFEFYISEPFTHTGALLEYALAEDVTVLGGWTAGWDTGFSRNGGSTLIGGLKLQMTERLAVSYMTSWGDAGFDDNFQPGSDQNGYFHTFLVTWDISDRWSYVFQSNMVDNDLLLGSTEDVVTWNNYLFYTINDCWKLGARLEWFKDPRLSSGRYRGAENEVIDLTVGLNYRPAANVVIRPELRWDDYHQTNQLNDTFLFGVDTVITY